MKNKKLLIIILIIVLMGVIGWLIWGSKSICGLSVKGPNYDVSYCDTSCNSYDDCQFTCWCGAINKDEVCHEPEGLEFDCVESIVRCENDRCVLGEEIIPINQLVIERCGIENDFECDPDCVDGFNEDCYFDSTKDNKDDFETGVMSLSEETRKACFAIRTLSMCYDCVNKFELKKNNGFEEVSCEEFFNTILVNNQSCNGCVEKVSAGCC